MLAYFVTQHTNEIGVRLALGATPRNILFLVLKKGMGLTLIGVVIGIAASFALTRLMSSLLFGVKASDPLTFVAVPLLLGLRCVVGVCDSRASRDEGRSDGCAAVRIRPSTDYTDHKQVIG